MLCFKMTVSGGGAERVDRGAPGQLSGAVGKGRLAVISDKMRTKVRDNADTPPGDPAARAVAELASVDAPPAHLLAGAVRRPGGVEPHREGAPHGRRAGAVNRREAAGLSRAPPTEALPHSQSETGRTAGAYCVGAGQLS